MNISGIGIVCHRGRGIENLQKALIEGWKKPYQAYYVPAEAMNDSNVLKEMRRADNLSKMACIAAYDAFADSGLGQEEKLSMGIILATAFGPHPTTFRFLDDIIKYGDSQVSPTIFSHSVHNAALSYVSYALQSRGPTLTITQFAHSFHQAVSLAEAWLNEGRCDYILVGTADQYGTVMSYICGQKLKIADDGIIRPFLFASGPAAVPGEGSVFFLLTNKETKKYAAIKALSAEISGGEPDMCILDCDGMTGNEERYIPVKKTNSLVSSYTPLFGSMLTGNSFSCAVSALMLKNQYCYAAPVKDNPHSLNLCVSSGPEALNKINCLKYGCKGEKIEFSLTR